MVGQVRQSTGDEEDLDEDRRVPEDLHVDRGQPVRHRDLVRARGTEDDADRERAGDPDRRDLEGLLEAQPEVRRWSHTNCQSKLASIGGEGGGRTCARRAPSTGYGQIVVTSFPTG